MSELFFGQAGFSRAATDDGLNNTMSAVAIGFALGKFTPVREMWHVSPGSGYNTVTLHGGSCFGASLGITSGARLQSLRSKIKKGRHMPPLFSC